MKVLPVLDKKITFFFHYCNKYEGENAHYHQQRNEKKRLFFSKVTLVQKGFSVEGNTPQVRNGRVWRRALTQY